MTDCWAKYRKINEKIQLNEELQADLEAITQEFERYRLLSDINGMVAVIAQSVLVPANMIVNAAPVGQARSLVQRLGKVLYEKYAASGTRIENEPANLIGMIKDVVIDELGRSGGGQWVPSVRLLTGLAQDSLALIETLQMVSQGSINSATTSNTLDLQLASVRMKIRQLKLQGFNLSCDLRTVPAVRLH